MNEFRTYQLSVTFFSWDWATFYSCFSERSVIASCFFYNVEFSGRLREKNVEGSEKILLPSLWLV